MAEVVASGVSKSFRAPDGTIVQALHEIDFHAGDGEFVCLLGPSGCGKTTLLNILSGLERPNVGRVELRPSGVREPVVAYMFQESRLLPWMTVRDNLRFVLDLHTAADRRRVNDWLARVGLERFADYYPRQLSIGMQQRVSVARALIIEPDVLFMDEPFSSLDELTAMSMREQLLELWEQLGCTVVFVTHNPMEATQLGDRVVIMSRGPGRITDEFHLEEHLPRPRDPDEEALWRMSRTAVAALRRDGGAGARGRDAAEGATAGGPAEGDDG